MASVQRPTGAQRLSEIAFKPVLPRCGVRATDRHSLIHSFSAGKRSRCIAQASSDELVLVKTEEQANDTVLFVFGTEQEKAAAAKSSPSQEPTPSSTPSTPPASSQPAQAHSDTEQNGNSIEAQPEKLEAAREVGSRVASAVKENREVEGSILEVAANLADSSRSLKRSPSYIAPKEALQTLTVPALRQLCKESQLTGYSNKRKDDLVEMLVETMENN